MINEGMPLLRDAHDGEQAVPLVRVAGSLAEQVQKAAVRARHPRFLRPAVPKLFARPNPAHVRHAEVGKPRGSRRLESPRVVAPKLRGVLREAFLLNCEGRAEAHEELLVGERDKLRLRDWCLELK